MAVFDTSEYESNRKEYIRQLHDVVYYRQYAAALPLLRRAVDYHSVADDKLCHTILECIADNPDPEFRSAAGWFLWEHSQTLWLDEIEHVRRILDPFNPAMQYLTELITCGRYRVGRVSRKGRRKTR